MESVKDKIQRIKLARMGEEHQFIAKVFSDLVPHKTKSKPNRIFFLKDDIPVISYDKKTNYLWCHHDLIWAPFQKLVTSNMKVEDQRNFNIMKHMREIIAHFALGHFNISGATFSMAHNFITDSWKNLKFRRVYSW